MSLVDGTFMCIPGDMPLSRRLHDSLAEVFVTRTRSSRPRAQSWGGRWWCPGCGVRAVTGDEHVRCEKCGEYLDELLPQLIELHPHGGNDGEG